MVGRDELAQPRPWLQTLRAQDIAVLQAQGLLGRRAVSIVSDNCWGAAAYRYLGLEYRSPFIGLFILPPCYTRMIERLDHFLGAALSFHAQRRYRAVNASRNEGRLPLYPIGRLDDDIELHFLHYADPDAASSSWNRRLGRVTDKVRIECSFSGRLWSADLVQRVLHAEPASLVIQPNGRRVTGVLRVPRFTADGWRLLPSSVRRFDLPAWLVEGTVIPRTGDGKEVRG
ncbi:DUF1919 domain-containing protein [Geodermatophilus sp. DF01-2]|nr:DUF1919 domain-containing protein [Geodermatophilus sp. DF01_2]